MIDVIRALALLAEPPTPQHRQVATLLDLPCPTPQAHLAVFGRAHPHASFYLNDDGMLGGDAADRVAGFYRALGEPVPHEVDHLTTVLAAYAKLVEREQDAPAEQRPTWTHLRTTFLIEHVLSWVPLLTDSVAHLSPAHADWARLVDNALEHEANRTPATTTSLPSSLSEAAHVPNPRTDGVASFLAGLLAPSRSGVVITDVDLHRCADELRLGCRVGTRQFVLRNLMEQDSADVLAWLNHHTAAICERRRRSWWARTRPGAHWCDLAADTSELLAELAHEARLAPAHPGR
jgi:hypothetical protein